MVEFVDGSVMAQLGPPDMRLPIQHALHYPERCAADWPKLDFAQLPRLEFEPADFDRWPALELGQQAPVAVAQPAPCLTPPTKRLYAVFWPENSILRKSCPLPKYVEHHKFDSHPTLPQLLEADRWARQEVTRWVCT